MPAEVIFAMELDGQFAHVAPKITEANGKMVMVTAMFLQLRTPKVYIALCSAI